MALITGLAHVNLTVPTGTLDAARAFYADTLGFFAAPVPALQRDTLAWFNIGESGQQIHVAFERGDAADSDAALSSRHPCFKVASPEALLTLQTRIFQHYKAGGSGAPQACDEPGGAVSGRFC